MQLRQGTYYRDADILLAEYDEENRDWSCRVLRQLGCRVTIAQDGVQTVNIARSRRFDALLLDCSLPRIDGYTAAIQIREHDRSVDRPLIPIVGLLHPTDSDRYTRFVQSGMDAWLPKPLDCDRTRHVLERLFRGERVAPTDETNGGDITRTELTVIVERCRELARIGGADLVDELVRIFPEDNGALVDEMEQALAAQDDAALYRLAHRLKSSAATLGLEQLACLCRELERNARDDALETPPSIIEKISRVYQRSLQRLGTALGEVHVAGT